MNTRNRFMILMFPLLAAAIAPAMATPVLDSSMVPAMASQGPSSDIVKVAATNGADAQAMVTKLGDTAMAAIADTSMDDAKKKALFRQILSTNFDMTTVGKFAAGRFWREATPAQQAEFLKLYQDMVINVYTSRFNNYSGQKFSVTGNRSDESGDAVVSSTVSGNGSPVNVDWRVRNKGAGPKIIDVMVEGVSMAVTQRNDFAGVIQQGGGNFQALIDYLNKGGTSDVKK